MTDFLQSRNSSPINSALGQKMAVQFFTDKNQFREILSRFLKDGAKGSCLEKASRMQLVYRRLLLLFSACASGCLR